MTGLGGLILVADDGAAMTLGAGFRGVVGITAGEAGGCGSFRDVRSVRPEPVREARSFGRDSPVRGVEVGSGVCGKVD